jgi:8-oxo-dGTP diphosphatase
MRSNAISSKAFIYRDSHYLLQHRDRDPGIFYPDYWGLFGGCIDPGETPEQGLLRELEEELVWCTNSGRYLHPWHPGDGSIVHIFLIALDVPVSSLELREGIEMRLVSADDMRFLKLAPEVEENIDKVLSIIQADC